MKQNLLDYSKLNDFLDKVFRKLSEENIDVSSFYLDHVCYRVETVKRYNELKSFLLDENKLLSENLINQRPIAVFKLKNPLKYLDRSISVLELPAPKTNVNYPEGFEHVEFVAGNLDLFCEKYPSKNFQTDIIPNNLTITLKYDGYSIKFHEKSLESVVMLEK